ncbi:MAG TPA: ABC transporter ATP-binding protein [Candidatus Sulfotelmatobacter sp.]|jgi:putative ABC transport system ATP-binding protein|nr:ABC transporter ATP-binding protein [Candidatus Sulfotelmatobacter sp.]
MSDLALDLRKVSLVYGGGDNAVRAVDGVDIAIRKGEMTAVMGPSGSGKTSVLMMMGCLLHPTEGTIGLLGRSVCGLDQNAMARLRLAHIGFIYQSYNLFPALSALETVRLALDLKGWAQADARAEAPRLLASVGLADRMNNRPGQLSGGQKQRVAIARALAGNPEIILGDEPTAALDSHTGRAVVELLRDLARREGRAVVVVTHDSRVGEVADRVISIVDGRIQSLEEERHKW